MVDRGRKRGKDRNRKISRTKRAFLMKQKAIFIVFEGLPFGKKKKKFDKNSRRKL